MSDNRNTGAPTLVGLLGLLFLGLKLGHAIDWSWWLVLLPFYGALGLFLAGSAIILIAARISEAIKADKRRRAINRARANPAGNSGRRISISGRRDSR